MTNSYCGSRLVAFSMATPVRLAWHAPSIIPSIILLIDEETEGGGNPFAQQKTPFAMSLEQC